MLTLTILLLLCGSIALANNLHNITITLQPVCRHYAVLAALTFSEKFPTRIVYGLTTEGGSHAQAQVLIDSEWHWLQCRHTSAGTFVTTGYREFEFLDGFYTTVSIIEFLTTEWIWRGD